MPNWSEGRVSRLSLATKHVRRVVRRLRECYSMKRKMLMGFSNAADKLRLFLEMKMKMQMIFLKAEGTSLWFWKWKLKFMIIIIVLNHFYKINEVWYVCKLLVMDFYMMISFIQYFFLRINNQMWLKARNSNVSQKLMWSSPVEAPLTHPPLLWYQL